MFIGRTDDEAPILWPPDSKSQLIGKDSDAGKEWGQEEKGVTEDEMASLTQWTRVWANSGRWWRTGKPGVLQSMGSQRVGRNWATEHHHRHAESTVGWAAGGLRISRHGWLQSSQEAPVWYRQGVDPTLLYRMVGLARLVSPIHSGSTQHSAVFSGSSWSPFSVIAASMSGDLC